MFLLSTMLGAAGSGVSLFGGLFGASSRRRTAQTNYEIDRHNAEIARQDSLATLELDRARNAIEFETAKTNAQFALLDAEARDRNAQRIRLFAESRSKAGREALRRQRRQFDQFKGQQRSAIAASGVAFEGSPLEVMAESAAQMQLALEDMHDEANLERMQSMDQATLEEFGAAQDRTAARASLRSAQAGFEFGNIANDLGRSRADLRYSASLFGAENRRASQFEQARGQTIGAVSGLFAGAAGYLDRRDRQRDLTLQPTSYRGIR